MNINNLNESSLLEIFSYLNLIEKINVQSVCKRWFELIKSIETKELCINFSRSFDESVSSNVSIKTNFELNKLLELPNLRNLKKLIINISYQVYKEPLIDLSSLFNLEHLEVNAVESIVRKMFNHLIKKQIVLIYLKYLNVRKIDLRIIDELFPNLTHLKTAFVYEIRNPYTPFINKLEYFEQRHYKLLSRDQIKFLITNCKNLRHLNVSLDVTTKIHQLIQECKQLMEINLNIPNDRLKSAFRSLPTIFKAIKISRREVTIRINGLILKSAYEETDKFEVDEEEIYTITYGKLSSLANKLSTDYSRNDLKFYFNNFKEIEITEKAILPIKHLFIYNLNLDGIKKCTFHFRNRNTTNYFFDKFFPRMPKIEHLFIAEVEKLTEQLLDQIPSLFPKITNLELHAYESVSFPINFISKIKNLELIVIKSNGFLKEAHFENVVKELKYCNFFELDPIYRELYGVVKKMLKRHPEVLFHMHRYSSGICQKPRVINNICFDRHDFSISYIFEYFNKN